MRYNEKIKKLNAKNVTYIDITRIMAQLYGCRLFVFKRPIKAVEIYLVPYEDTGKKYLAFVEDRGDGNCFTGSYMDAGDLNKIEQAGFDHFNAYTIPVNEEQTWKEMVLLIKRNLEPIYNGLISDIADARKSLNMLNVPLNYNILDS